MFRNTASTGRTQFSGICALAVVFALGPLTFRVQAQTLYGSVVGNITDPSGAAVPGATVTVINMETGFNRQVNAGDSGAYSVPDLQAGRYEVKVVTPSFANFTRQGVTVSNNAVVRVDVQVQLAATSQNVTVTDSAAVLQTDRSDVRAEISTKQFQDLPVSGGRVYQSLFKLIPGFTPPRTQNSLVSNGGEDLVAEVNGTTKSTNNTRIDGASNTNVWLPQHSAYVPPLESIESVNVATNSMDAEQGQAGGAAVNVTIKSGTNDFHGVGFEYNTDSAIQARNVFYNSPTLPKNIQNQYGGTLGGPIVRNKLFFFVGDEQTSRRANVSRLATIPTAAQRAGDFSGLGTVLYDPLTGNADGSGRAALRQ